MVMEELKKLWKCRVTIFLLLGWAALSVIGYLGKDNIYKEYKLDVRKTPYFVVVFQGIKDGVYPWSRPEEPFEPGLREEVAAGTETGSEPGEGTGNETETGSGNGAEGGNVTEAGSEPGEGTGDGAETEEPPAVKEFIPVDESYFDDAVFIGDSRTVGLHDYGGLDKATFYATVGLNVYDMWKEKFCEVNGKKVTLEEALRAQSFGKIYFQIGINEMGRGTIDTFMQEYEQAVEKFRELQPGAIIYVQGIMRVTKEKSDSDAIFNNPGIVLRNDRIAQLADNQTVFYIDMNEVVCDEQGNLKEELTFDNLHLYGSKYDIWVDFLKTKGIAL